MPEFFLGDAIEDAEQGIVRETTRWVGRSARLLGDREEAKRKLRTQIDLY